MLILIAGPYRSGTNNDPNQIQNNLDKLESVALPIFEMGHIPIIGEWVALPLLKLAGAEIPGDSIWQKIQYPVAHRLIKKCDAILRMPGESKGADMDIAIAKEMEIPVFYSLEEIPNAK